MANEFSNPPHLCDFRFIVGRETYADIKIIGKPVTIKTFDRLISQLQLQRDVIAPDFCGRKMTAADIAPAPTGKG